MAKELRPTWKCGANRVIHVFAREGLELATADAQEGDAVIVHDPDAAEPELLIDGQTRGYVVALVVALAGDEIHYHRERADADE
jgi:hypothetical protein